MSEKIAIATTLRDAHKVLDFFLEYHLSIGFDHIFLFFDDPLDPSLDMVNNRSAVSLFSTGLELEQEWKKAPSYDKVRGFIDDHVMARQILNTETALRKALDLGIHWLLHIDIDELFYTPRQSLKEHLRALKNLGLQGMTYPNHEAVPEQFEVDHYFRDITFFKKNLSVIPPEQRQQYRRFLYYSNGKSVTRVRPGVAAGTVHNFTLPEETLWPQRLLYPYRKGPLRLLHVPKNPRFLSTGQTMISRILARSMANRPAILHYPCCGFENFWNKYLILGKFPDKWFDRLEIGRLLPFHLEARDIVLNEGRQAAKAFYKERVMMLDQENIDRYLATGLGCRIEGPARLRPVGKMEETSRNQNQ